MNARLSDLARDAVAEEEALLARVNAALANRPEKARSNEMASLATSLVTLRDEAAGANEHDLPSLLQQMATVRALFDRERVEAQVDEKTPYFAHLRLRTKDGARDYLLGRATFADTKAGVRIVDWRYAPIARIFYSYEEGDPFEEELPGGLMEGVVEVRRVVVIENGQLTRILAGPLSLTMGDEGWRETDPAAGLGGGAGSAARPGVLGIGADATSKRTKADITALLDAEQFDAVHASPDRSLLVLGSAGSGKTTVALHRLSSLAFEHPRRFPTQRLQVVVPEAGLARLSRRLLEPLDLGAVKVATLDEWLHQTALETFRVKSIAVNDDAPGTVTRLKRHPALREPLLKALKGNLSQVPFRALRRRLLETFADPSFIEDVVERANGDLSQRVTIDIARHTMRQLATLPDQEIDLDDSGGMSTLDGRALDAGTPDDKAGTCDPEDLALLLFLRGQTEPGSIAHLLLDEAEDFSVFDLAALKDRLEDEASSTLAGDEMQQTTSNFPGWESSLKLLGAADAARCRLQVSYRCPRPITELAQRILGTQAPEDAAKSGRDGAPVSFHSFPDEAQGHLFLADALRGLLDRERDASVGIIASTPEAARRVYRMLEDMPESRLVLDGEFTFAPGIDVTDVDNVKGLEFDYVILSDASASAYPDTPESRRRLHVAVTRASHQLWLMTTGRMTPLV